MQKPAQAWDERYEAQGYPAGTEPAPFLVEALPLLPRGRALDLAAGAGRNAVFLATHGWQVIAVDASRVALEKAQALAHERAISAVWARSVTDAEASRKAPLVLVQQDLEGARLPVAKCELVICFNYLQRSLFPAIERAVAAAGVLVYETYTVNQLAHAQGPRNPKHLLQRNELRSAFPNLTTVFYREFSSGKGIASLLAGRP